MGTAIFAVAFVLASLGALGIVAWRRSHKSGTRMDYQMAMVALQHQLRRNPKDAGLHVKMGLLLARRRNFAAAVESLSRAIELEPQRAEARFHRGLTLREMGRHKEAAEDFQWIRTHSENAYYKTAVRSLRRG